MLGDATREDVTAITHGTVMELFDGYGHSRLRARAARQGGAVQVCSSVTHTWLISTCNRRIKILP